MSGFKLNRAVLNAELSRLTQPRAKAAGSFLREALSGPGSGILWGNYGNKNRSSRPGEYPAEQTGALIRSVDVRPDDSPTSYKLGFFSDKDAEGFAHAVELEERPASEGGRYPLELALGDKSLRETLVTGKVP